MPRNLFRSAYAVYSILIQGQEKRVAKISSIYKQQAREQTSRAYLLCARNNLTRFGNACLQLQPNILLM